MIVVFRQICKKGDKQTNFGGNLPHLPEEDEDDEALRPAKNQFVFRTTHLGQYQYLTIIYDTLCLLRSKDKCHKTHKQQQLYI